MSKNVKKIIVSVLISVLISLSALSANEVSAVWSRLFRRADSMSQKTSLMTSIVEQHSRDMIPVLVEALEEQIAEIENTGSTTDKQQRTEFIKMVVKELGRLKAREASALIWQIVHAFDDPLLRGEAIIALGKIGAREYSEEMNLMLRNLNFNYGDIQDQRSDEIVAYSLVVALNRLKQPDSFSPLFFASTGWYSSRSRVKEKASSSLTDFLEDPTEQLEEIMVSSDDFSIKIAALKTGSESSAAERNKAVLAVEALKEGLQYSPENQLEKQQLKDLRIMALNMLETLPEKLPEAEPFMARMLTLYRTQRVFDLEEMVNLFETYGTYSSDESVKPLTEFLAYLTERRESGVTFDSRIPRSVIIALGNSGNSLAFEELTNVEFSDAWESSIKREAKSALQKLGN